MPMPEKNHFFENLPAYCDVELRPTEAGGNHYYVAIIDDEEGVVIMEGNKQREQQAALERMVMDTKMRRKGYRCRISHPSIGEPLYVKNIIDVGPLLRQQYPNLRNVETALIV